MNNVDPYGLCFTGVFGGSTSPVYNYDWLNTQSDLTPYLGAGTTSTTNHYSTSSLTMGLFNPDFGDLTSLVDTPSTSWFDDTFDYSSSLSNTVIAPNSELPFDFSSNIYNPRPKTLVVSSDILQGVARNWQEPATLDYISSRLGATLSSLINGRPSEHAVQLALFEATHAQNALFPANSRQMHTAADIDSSWSIQSALGGHVSGEKQHQSILDTARSRLTKIGQLLQQRDYRLPSPDTPIPLRELGTSPNTGYYNGNIPGRYDILAGTFDEGYWDGVGQTFVGEGEAVRDVGIEVGKTILDPFTAIDNALMGTVTLAQAASQVVRHPFQTLDYVGDKAIPQLWETLDDPRQGGKLLFRGVLELAPVPTAVNKFGALRHLDNASFLRNVTQATSKLDNFDGLRYLDRAGSVAPGAELRGLDWGIVSKSGETRAAHVMAQG